MSQLSHLGTVYSLTIVIACSRMFTKEFSLWHVASVLKDALISSSVFFFFFQFEREKSMATLINSSNVPGLGLIQISQVGSRAQLLESSLPAAQGLHGQEAKCQGWDPNDGTAKHLLLEGGFL